MKKIFKKSIVLLLTLSIILSINLLSVSANTSKDIGASLIGSANSIGNGNTTNSPTNSPDTPSNSQGSSETAETFPFLFGDIDSNGNVNASDALIMLKASVGKTKITDSQKVIGDVNKDGHINAVDALAALQLAVGKISPTKQICPHLIVKLDAKNGFIKTADGLHGVNWTTSSNTSTTVSNGTVSGGGISNNANSSSGTSVSSGSSSVGSSVSGSKPNEPVAVGTYFNYKFYKVDTDKDAVEIKCHDCDKLFNQKLTAPYTFEIVSDNSSPSHIGGSGQIVLEKVCEHVSVYLAGVKNVGQLEVSIKGEEGHHHHTWHASLENDGSYIVNRENVDKEFTISGVTDEVYPCEDCGFMFEEGKITITTPCCGTAKTFTLEDMSMVSTINCYLKLSEN